MRRAALALALVPTLGFAQKREVVEVERGELVTPAGERLSVAGGAYLPNDSLLATARELAALRAENAALKREPAPAPRTLLLTGLAAFVLGAGVAAGVAALQR